MGTTLGAGGGGGKAAAAAEADKELTKAHSREVNRLTAELEDMAFKAELHVDMSSTLSSVLKTLYARNLQLEDLLRGAGVEVNDEASQHELTPLRINSIVGFQIGQLEAGRDCPDGDLRNFGKSGAGGGGGSGEGGGGSGEGGGRGEMVALAGSGSGGLPPVSPSPAVR